MAANGAPSLRIIMQQCVSARLQVQPATEDKEAEFVESIIEWIVTVDKYSDPPECITVSSLLAACYILPGSRGVMSALNVKLSEIDGPRKVVSVLDLPGDVLIVPQATLGGKMKGKRMQYHSNISKEDGVELYQGFVNHCKEVVENSSAETNNDTHPVVRYGTYGNRQVLSVVTNGPFTHCLDF